MTCFTETWLNKLTPDSHITLDGFQLVRTDRKGKDCRKRNGGGIAMFVNNRWCNPGHITVKEQLCTTDIKLLAVSILPPRVVLTCYRNNCVHPPIGQCCCCLRAPTHSGIKAADIIPRVSPPYLHGLQSCLTVLHCHHLYSVCKMPNQRQ